MDTTLSEASLMRWHVRLGRAADLIAARLDDPPSLEELAAVAAVSPFHMHRIWRGLTGETVRQSIARLRIEAVRPALAAGGSVTEAAMAAGFATPQAFARAFRRTTGTTPSLGRARVGGEVAEMPIRIELRDAVSVVALRRQGGEYVALNAMFQAVWDWAAGADALEGLSGLYGIPYDDPASVDVGDLRYAACMAFGSDAPAPVAPLQLIALPGGDHARLRHVGGYDALQPLSQWLVGEWLPRSGREPAAAPLYHHFHNDPDSAPEAEWVTDILLPLVPMMETER